jgi:16S rRNA (cytidine1402-2'-O)-methyltransferase
MASDEQSRTSQRAAEVLGRLVSEPLPPGLYVVATPIGNLADITLRALAVLERADVIYCEDTRHSRTLLSHYAISRPLRAYHEHNAERERPHILTELSNGKRVALISDAGTPLISDPGYKLVRAAVAERHAVISLPGASAVLTALAAAGLATDTFLFAGFLPNRQGTRRSRLGELKATPATLVFFEAPSRLADSLADIAAVLGDRETAVARELTKLHEEVRRGSAAELAQWAETAAPRGEMVILVGPPNAATLEVTDDAITSRLRTLLADLSLRDAAKAVAEDLGVTKARVYDLGLALKRADQG